uniref:tRNA (adenine(58)-N(1))-methyltransferase non-catalytic subunit trm6 n=1 Tax=Erigeron canadensis TaxID=72917 RepID=UPI001CB8D5AB|nr:tRNA (adenine(58)-N(1))-methyltransferase non-catalytic subunit trm6 [Erigeron canadensis]
MNTNNNNSKEVIQSVNNGRITWEGCSVLLDVNDGDRLLFSRLTPGSIVKIGNKNYPLHPLIGCPFGSLFQVENGINGPCLSRVTSTANATQGANNSEDKMECESKDESRDNRALVDNNTAQTLTGDDIEGLRRQGASGNEIVEALIANSATFENKTSFSQEKYRLKKQKKYAPKVLLRRPVARSICDTYFKKYPARIGFLRVDTLSLLLSFANVTAQSDVLVVDMVGGMVTGAVAERLGGTGYVCSTYRGASPHSIEIVRMFNFGDEINKRIVRLPLAELSAPQNVDLEENGLLQDASIVDIPPNEIDESLSTRPCSLPVSMEETTVSSEDGRLSTQSQKVAPKLHKAAQPGEKAPEDAVKLWKENGFSSLIIAAPDMDAWSIVKEVLPYLAFSAPFVIYHQYLQPLATCMHNLQVEKLAIGLQITEPWLREYQVLPLRTHPHMQMSAFGGFVLSGTKIYNDKQPNK